MGGIKFWLIVGLVAIIIYLIISRPAPYDSNKDAYLDTLNFLRAKEASIIAQGQRIIKTYEDRVKADSLNLATKDVEIKAIKVRVIIKRIPVQPLIDSIPTLRAFVELQDSLIQVQGQQIDTLKQAYASQIQTTKDLIQNHDAQARISERISEEKDLRIENLEKQNRRKNRGVKFWKVATVVSLVGGFFLGSQL